MSDWTFPHDLKKQRRFVLFLLCFAAAALALGVSPHWRISPDSALYAGMARSIATGEGYAFAGVPQTSIPPAVPLYFSAAWSLANVVHPHASVMQAAGFLNIFTGVAGFLGIIAAFYLAVEISGLSRTVVALALLVTSARYFSAAIEPLTDVPFAAVSIAAILFLLRFQRRGRRGDAVAAAVFLALTPLVRVAGVALVASAAAIYLLRARRPGASARDGHLFYATVPALCVTAFFSPFLFAKSPSSFNYISDITVGRGAWEIARGVALNLTGMPGYLFEAVFGFESALGLSYALLALVILGAAALWRRGWKLPVTYAAAYVLFVALAYPVLPRYFIPVLLFVFLFMVEGVVAAAAWCQTKSRLITGGTVTVVASTCLVIILATNLFYVAREVGRNFSNDFYSSYKRGRYHDYIEAASNIRRKRPAGRIMALQSRIIFALTGVETVWIPWHPDARRRPTNDELARYVRGNRVTLMVVDARDPESAAIFVNFIRTGPLRWRVIGHYGAVTLFALSP